MKTKYIVSIVAMSAVAALFGIVGSMDYADAKAEADHYEQMVCDGYWPDYRGVNPVCDGEQPKIEPM